MIFERLQKEFEAARASQTQGILIHVSCRKIENICFQTHVLCLDYLSLSEMVISNCPQA